MILQEFLANLSDLPAKYYIKYFEFDTLKVYSFYNLDIQKAEIATNNDLVVSAKMPYVFPENCQALNRNAHGGCISFILDSFLGVALGFPRLLPNGAIMQTRELKIEVLKPIAIGKNVVLSASFKNVSDERKFWVNGDIRDEETNELLAVADGFFLKVGVEKLM
jgi:acyl-coenzyme A thioesterase PaaI-like protein